MIGTAAYGRALLCRACGHDVPLPGASDSLEQWTSAVAGVVGVDHTWFDELCGDLEPDARAGIAHAAMQSTEAAQEMLPVYAEVSADQRASGTFYTAQDVCDSVVTAVLDDTVRDATGGQDDSPAVIRHVLLSQRIIDPTCGSGAFLHAAARDVCARLIEHGMSRADAAAASLATIHGVDVSVVAVEAARAVLLTWAIAQGVPLRIAQALITPRVRAGDATSNNWYSPGEYTCGIGNPPFVRAAPADAPPGIRTASAGNYAAWIAERCLDAVAPGGRVALILPLSTICADGFESARAQWEHACDEVRVRSFDCIPATLFPGVVQRIAILDGRRRHRGSDEPCVWRTDGFHRWLHTERAQLFEPTSYVVSSRSYGGGSLARIGSDVERDLLAHIHHHSPAERLLTARDDDGNGFWYKRRWSYHLLVLDFIPEITTSTGDVRVPTEFKRLGVRGDLDARALLAIYASSLFWWYFNAFGDSRNLNRRELAAFPVPELDASLESDLVACADALMEALRSTAEQRECTYRSIGTITNTYFRHRQAAEQLARIDDVVARAYELSGEQRDFIAGFEARFRWGAPVASATTFDAAAR